MEEDKKKLIKIIQECNDPNELKLLKFLITETYQDVINLYKNKNLENKDNEILDRYLRTFEDFPNTKAGILWDYVERDLNIYTVGDLINTPPHKLLRFRGIGKYRIKQLEEWLAKYNLEFKRT